jgi:hypothetical protein
VLAYESKLLSRETTADTGFKCRRTDRVN